MSQIDRSKPSGLYSILGWLVALLTPVALVLAAVRLLMVPQFLTFEYSMPGFPADLFGFDKEDRLHWAGIALDYLLNDQGIEFLGDLRFEDGAAVYNERELQHMVDVKNALNGALTAWVASLAILVILGLWAWRGGWWAYYRRGLSRGGWLTVIFVVGVIVFVIVGFGILFVAFHNVFFEPGTWMFSYSDTLIRLFPERFWRDIFIYIGVLSAALGLLIAFLARPSPQRRDPGSSA